MKEKITINVIDATTETNVLRYVLAEDASMAAKELLAPLFNAGRVEVGALTGALLRAAIGATSCMETACQDEGTSAREFWRHFQDMSLAELEQFFIARWRSLFWLFVERFGLLSEGFDVLIDEHQTIFFGRPRRFKKDRDGGDVWVIEDAALTEVAQLVGTSKKDKYSGAYRALEFQCMVARFRKSGIILPLDIFLVATDGPLQIGHLMVPERKPQVAMKRFMDTLEHLYVAPKGILFDRGYHADLSFTVVAEYCQRHPTVYMTPVRRENGEVTDGHGTWTRGIRSYFKDRFNKAEPIRKGSDIGFVVGRRDVKNRPDVPRNMVTLYKPIPKKRAIPTTALAIGESHFACGFYTNHPNPAQEIVLFERFYSRRWGIENWFKGRAKNFNNGRAHLAVRRVVVFYVGILVLALLALIRKRRVPVFSLSEIRARASMRRLLREFMRGLNLATVVRRRRKGAAAA